MQCTVLHLLGTAQPEGAGIARIVAALATGLDPAKYQLHAWFLGPPGPLASELRAQGVNVRELHWDHGARDPVGAWKFWRRLRAENFSLVHQHFGGRAPAWIARTATGSPLIKHVWGNVYEAADDVHPIHCRAHGADAVISTSRSVDEWVSGANRTVVYPGVPVPNGSTAVHARRDGSQQIVIGAAGRLVPMKGFVHLIRAMELLRKEFPEVRLEIAGDGPLCSQLQREATRLGLDSHVTFLGWQTEIGTLFERWDVYVQPSIIEPFGIAALEAMAAGLPVIATSGSGLAEVVADGITGWLAPPGDPTALAERLRQLLVNPAQRKQMGAAGQDRAREHFSTGRMVTSISRIYESLLASR